MAKKRSRRAASPAQLAAQKRFAEMVRSGAFSRKNPKRKKAKKASHAAKKARKAAKRKAKKKVARHNPAHARKHAKKHARKHTRKHARRRARRNEGSPFARASVPKAKKARAPKGAKAAEAALSAVSPAASKPKRQRRKLSPAEKAAKARKKALRKKNAAKIKKVRSALASARAELKAMPKGSRPKKGEKRGKRSAKRRILSTKKSALNLTYSSLIGSMAPAEAKMLKAAGLMRANPGIGEIFSSIVALAPQLGAQAVGLAGVAVAGQKLGDMIAAKMPASMPGRAFIAKNAVTISSVAAAIAAYEVMKHASPKTRPFAGAVLMGGMAAAFVHAAARMPSQKAGNLGRAIGLPIGPMAVAAPAPAAPAVSGFVDVGGRAVAVDGIGEYMALSGSTLTGSSLGEYMALSGSTLTGSSLGEYMALSGSTLTGSSLGEIGQMSEGRQGARALNSPGDVPVEDFVDDEDDEDEGSLSGSIFDD